MIMMMIKLTFMKVAVLLVVLLPLASSIPSGYLKKIDAWAFGDDYDRDQDLWQLYDKTGLLGVYQRSGRNGDYIFTLKRSAGEGPRERFVTTLGLMESSPEIIRSGVTIH